MCIVAFGSIITLSALNQRNAQTPSVPKKDANEYFRFSAVARGTPVNASDPEKKDVKISGVDVNITAIEGNATKIYIIPRQGMVKQDFIAEHLYFDKILQGKSVDTDEIAYNSDVLSTKVEGKGYPLIFSMRCDEAEGEVTIYATLFS